MIAADDPALWRGDLWQHIRVGRGGVCEPRPAIEEDLDDDIGYKHPLSSSDDEGGDKGSILPTSKGTPPPAKKETVKSKEDLKKQYKQQYREKAQAKAKVMKKVGAKIECRGCRARRNVEFFFVNDVYDKVCKRPLRAPMPWRATPMHCGTQTWCTPC